MDRHLELYEIPQPSLMSVWEKLPLYEPPLVKNVLRRHQKLLISGASKSGKTSLAIQLAIAVAEGTYWLENECEKGGVLFVNFGLSTYMMFSRVNEIYSSLNIEPNNVEQIDIINYKGNALADNYIHFMDSLQNIANGNKYRLIIIDSIDYVQGFSDLEASRHINRLLDNLMIQTNTCIAFTTSSGNPPILTLCDSVAKLIPTGDKAVSDFRLSIENNTYQKTDTDQQLLKYEYPIMQVIGSYNPENRQYANELKREKSIKEFEEAFYKLSPQGEPVPVLELTNYFKITRESLYRKVKKIDDFEINLGMVEPINNK